MQLPLREALAPIRNQGNQIGNKFESGLVFRKYNGSSFSFSASAFMVSTGKGPLGVRYHSGWLGARVTNMSRTLSEALGLKILKTDADSDRISIN